MNKIIFLLVAVMTSIISYGQTRLHYAYNDPREIAYRDSVIKAYDAGVEKKKMEDFDKRYSKAASEEKERKRIDDSLRVIRWKQWEKQDIDDSIAAVKAKRLQIQQNKEDAAKQKAIKEANAKKLEEHKKWLIDTYGQDIANKMSNHQVVIGWTKEMCIQSWGKPYEVNKTTTQYGVNEQWVYSLKRYLYFEGDKLTATQD